MDRAVLMIAAFLAVEVSAQSIGPTSSWTSSLSSSCAGGFVQHGASCYGLVDVKETWADAQATCRALGGHLAEVFSLDESQFVEQLMTDHHTGDAWLGGEDLLNHGTWYWSNAKVTVAGGFTNWKVGSPNSDHDHADENCMKLSAHSSGATWEPDECDDKAQFICQTPSTGDDIVG